MATIKSAKNKEVQVIQETERGEIQPKAPGDVKQVRKIVPTLVSQLDSLAPPTPTPSAPAEMNPIKEEVEKMHEAEKPKEHEEMKP